MAKFCVTMLLILIQGLGVTSAQDININLGDIPAGQAVTVTYQVEVGTINHDALFITNQGIITGDGLANTLTDDPQVDGSQDITVTEIGNIRSLPSTGESHPWRVVFVLIFGGVLSLLAAWWSNHKHTYLHDF